MASKGVLEAKPPALSSSDAERIAAGAFGVRGRARLLESERDQNFQLCADDGRAFVLKIANRAEDPAVLDFQTRALEHVAERDPGLPVPRVVRSLGGEPCPVVDGHRVRLVSFLHGQLLEDASLSPRLLRHLGASLARLGRALRGFFHPAAGHELFWDLKQAAALRAHGVHIGDRKRRALAEQILERFESGVLPQLPGLRAQVIHNDVSRGNTLVDAERVTGIFDFGDMVHAPLVCDLAVTCAEVMLGADEPVSAAAELVAGYAGVEALRDEERSLLFDLVAARLAVGVCVSAWRVRDHPENRAYIAGDDPAHFAVLERLDVLEPALRGAFLSAGEPAGAPETPLETLLERRRRRLAPGLSHFYQQPLHLVRGRGAWLVDASGRAYLDAYNNVPHVGHCHPAVVEAIARQAATLNTNTRYVYESVLEYAERLASALPGELGVVSFVCSGSEANDLAWRLAKAHSGNAGALVVEHAYHGSTDAVAAFSPSELLPGAGLAPHVRAVPAPDDYRGPYRRGEPDLTERYAAGVDAAIASLREAGLAPAAFFVDSVLSSSGILTPPDGWLRAAFAKVRAAGGVCVADEVQAGFGRTGAWMWGFEAHGALPDVVTLGKPIGNGHPLAAVVTTPAIARSFAERAEFFSTFGGNPVSCAAGLAVLEVLEREGLRENARAVGARLRAGLEALAGSHAWIGDVRGHGLFLGVDLVRERERREPARAETGRVLEGLRERGVLVGSDGPHANVLKIRPPLCFSGADAERLLDALDATLGTLGSP